MQRKPSHLPSTSGVLFPLAIKQKYYFVKLLKIICHSPQRCSRVHYFPVFEIHAALLISSVIKKKNPSSWIIGSYERVSCHSRLRFCKQSKMSKRAHSGSGPLFESWRRWGFSWALSLRLSVCWPGQIAHLSKNALSLLVSVIRTGGWPQTSTIPFDLRDAHRCQADLCAVVFSLFLFALGLKLTFISIIDLSQFFLSNVVSPKSWNIK